MILLDMDQSLVQTTLTPFFIGYYNDISTLKNSTYEFEKQKNGGML
jgi:hypothetical protein